MYINPKHIIFILIGINILLILYILFSKKQPIVVNVNNGQVVLPNQNQNNNSFLNSELRNTNCTLPNPQSDFFRKSIQFASDYLKGNSDFDVHSVPENAQKILNSTKIFSEQIKQNIITAMNYFSVDAINAPKNENHFRTMSSTEKLPVWIIILREATAKVVPDLNLHSTTSFNPNFVQENANLKIA